jgi:imidazolonepropionase-like amidohydrolase
MAVRTGKISRRAFLGGSLSLAGLSGTSAAFSKPIRAIKGAQWFDGTSFTEREGFVFGGLFTFHRPARIDDILDLTGAYLVPPYADAHNHGIGTGDEQRDRAMIRDYLRAGVFYMQSQGNLPLTAADKARLGLNRADGLDAILAQGSITGPGGHPMGLIRDLVLPRGGYPGYTLETLRDVRFYEVGSEVELHAKWPLVRAAGGDFVKYFLINSESHAERRDDPAYFGRRGVDPALARSIVALAHGDGKRASAHVKSSADFATALESGADIVAHVPQEELTPELVRRAAQRKVVVTTTTAFLARIHRGEPASFERVQKHNLRVLRDAGVHLAIGSDDPADPTPGEISHLSRLGVFSNAELLAMWTGSTARAIFPGRRIGALEEGYEASLLALDADPLDDLAHAQAIRLRMKQGIVLTA